MRYARPSIAQSSISSPHAHADAGEPEEGEAMEVENEDDEDMMAMMGLTGFGSTKVLLVSTFTAMFFSYHSLCQGQHVIGNQDGASNVKKPRTWRQYMNRYVFLNTASLVHDVALCLDVGDSIGLWIESSSLYSHHPHRQMLYRFCSLHRRAI